MASIVVEGDLDEVIVVKVASSVGLRVDRVFGKKGKDWIGASIGRYREAAEHDAWLVVVDLDQSHECPAALVTDWLPNGIGRLCLRVAVRAIESWLLADRAEFARFLGVRQEMIPTSPDSILDPKGQVVSLARASRLSAIRTALVPRPESGRAIGAGYTAELMKFAQQQWNPDRAARQSPSLVSSLSRIRDLARE